MTKITFILRLVLLIIVGLIYVKAYMSMAKRNNRETQPQKHTIMKVLGGLFLLLAIFWGICSVYTITRIDFPPFEIEPMITANTIVRLPGTRLYWGILTMPQFQCISLITGMFASLALSAYCFLFKNSFTKWWVKVGKIVFCVIFFALLFSTTDFHYFDLYEFIAPAIFLVMLYFAFQDNKKKENEVVVLSENTEYIEEKEVAEETVNIKKTDNSRFMPPSITDEKVEESIYKKTSASQLVDEELELCNDEPHIETEVKEELPVITTIVSKENVSEEIDKNVNNEDEIKFCRHCGKPIDYNCGMYCKYCGKPLN